ncbi:hypothetical protein ACFVJS_18790, partial [Nocardioides sp. NPDC057772]|uniref:hypothetical protein n=1 Tax=Nocardioides sp. NPDC057772 TaxID=3346245 RepID=UPI00366F7AD6
SIFTLASAWCGIAWDPISLVLARFVQGLGGGDLGGQGGLGVRPDPLDAALGHRGGLEAGGLGDRDADVSITWRESEAGEWRTSTGTAEDRYANVDRLLDRDCAERTLTEAAEVTVGEPRVEGEGKQSGFVLPVTFAPTEKAPDVTFDGWEGTVLFQLADETPTWPRSAPHPMTGEPITLELRVLPARCDPHALADDKVGSLFRVHVGGPGLPEEAAYFLPLDKPQKAALYDFLPGHCGWE